MKKLICPLVFGFFVSLQAYGVSSFEVSGEIGLQAAVWNLPSGERGNSQFDLSTFFLDFSAELQDFNYFQLTIESYDKDFQLREAYLDLVSPFRGMKALRVGLLPQPWLKSYYEIWDYRFVEQNSWGLLEKWNYQSFSDYGLSYMSDFAQGRGDWAVTLTNGKKIEDRGPHKEFSVFGRWNSFRNWILAGNYSRGSYDRYSADDDLKERIQLMVVHTQERWKTGIELLYARDSNFAHEDYELAEGVETSNLEKGLVTGVAASAFATFATGPKAETFVRIDYLDAATGEDGKTMQTYLLGLAYQYTEDVRLATMVDYTVYEKDYFPGARDKSKIVIAAQVLF